MHIKNCKENGNVLVYVLIAVALLAALTYSISGENRGQEQNRLTEAQVKIYAADLIKHAAAAEQALYTMEQWGVDYDEVLFDLPSSANYNTNVTQQIYHPSGGGLSFMNKKPYLDPNHHQTRGWKFQTEANVEWSSTSATDIIFSFIDLEEEICQEINRILHGDPTMPSVGFFGNIFIETATNSNLTASYCGECENVKSMCVQRPSTTQLFYNIIGAR